MIRDRGTGFSHFLLVLATGVGACAPHPEQPAPVEPKELPPSDKGATAPASADTRSEDLVFLGRVTSIAIADTGNPRREWVVTTKVERVLSGSFSGSHFSFAVHSPAKSGLEVGKHYSIRATRTPSGYRVDETPVAKAE